MKRVARQTEHRVGNARDLDGGRRLGVWLRSIV